MDYKPLYDKVIFKPLSSEQSFGGIIIPDTSVNLKKGIVTAISNRETSLYVNQTIFYKSDDNDGMPFTLHNEQYIVMSSRYVWMVD